jgi:hypothetical protein
VQRSQAAEQLRELDHGIGEGIKLGVGLASPLAGGIHAASEGDWVGVGFAATPLVGKANKLNHIFGRSIHKLAPLVAKLGSRERAYDAVVAATRAALAQQRAEGAYRITVTVEGYIVEVKGTVLDGVVHIGTFFIR